MPDPFPIAAAQQAAPPDTADHLGARLLAALPALALRQLCLFDHDGQPLWRSEGPAHPREADCVTAALTTLTAQDSKAHTQQPCDPGHGALFLAIRTPRGTLAGLAMLLLEARVLATGNLAARILTAAVREVLQQAAAALSPGLPSAPDPADGDGLDLQLLEPEAPPPEPLALPEPPHPGAPAQPPAALLLQEFERLHGGGATRRFKVSPANDRLRGDAATTLEQLLAWLRAHPQALRDPPLAFTIAVSASALKDERLSARLAALLQDAPLANGQISFEVREPACITLRPRVQRLLEWCERHGCGVVIDDFSFDSAALELLRSSAVRLLKVDARLCAGVLRDRLAQARLIAIVQAAKVLGVHCVAKYVDARAGRAWLAAAGFDFAQSRSTAALPSLLP